MSTVNKHFIAIYSLDWISWSLFFSYIPRPILSTVDTIYFSGCFPLLPLPNQNRTNSFHLHNRGWLAQCWAMLSSGFRRCRLFSTGSFGKPTQLSSVRCLKTFRLLFPHSSCSTVQICSHSRKLHDKKVETHQEQHHTEEDTKTGSNEGTDQGKEIKLSQRQRLKKVFAEYGATAVVFHISMSLTSLGICYTALKRWVECIYGAFTRYMSLIKDIHIIAGRIIKVNFVRFKNFE